MRMAALFLIRVSKKFAFSSTLIKSQPWKPSYRFAVGETEASSFRSKPWKRGFCTAIGETEASGFRANVISREMIRPIFPTPSNKKTVKFSLIDQVAPSIYNCLVFFFQNDPSSKNLLNANTAEQKTVLLKSSLSEMLVDFYPLAGRIQQNELIDCSDQGVEFCEARLSKNLAQIIETPQLEIVQALLPFQGHAPRHKNIVLGVQVNHFSCGGMAIGVCLSHKIADAAAVCDFVKAWGNKAQGRGVASPKFNGATLFPPLKKVNEFLLLDNNDETVNLTSKKERVAIRRLIFDKAALDDLKAQAVASNTITHPTRVEVVTAFIWKHLPEFSSVLHFVNIRKKMVPPIPENSFGNLAWMTRTSPMSVTSKEPESIIKELRKGFKRIDNNYIRELFSSDDFLDRLKKENDIRVPMLAFSSVSALPLYNGEVDFGMGKLVWVSMANMCSKNFSILVNTQCGHGIEAWICLLEDDIAKLDLQLSKLPYPLLKTIEMK